MFDLIIYCVGQKQPCSSFPKNNIFVEIEQRYCDTWEFITKQEGIWYSLLTNENELAGTAICEHLGFDTTMFLPEEDDMDIINNLTPYTINSSYKESFQEMIQFFLECSPINLLYILARYQSADKEIVQGIYTIERFFSLMDKKNIYANVCYIIANYPNALN